MINLYYLIITILVIITIVYSIYRKKINEDTIKLTQGSKLKFYLFIGVIIIVLLLFSFNVIEFEFVFQDSTMSSIFSVLNGLLFGSYINLLGLFPKTSNKIWKYSIAFLSILFFLLGTGSLGISLTLNINWFINGTFITNSYMSAMFYGSNIGILNGIALATFLSESEVK